MATVGLLSKCLKSECDKELISALEHDTDNTRYGVRGVRKDKKLRQTLISLLPFTGLLHDFQLGSLKRIWDARYSELDVNYLQYVERTWTSILANVAGGPRRLSASGVQLLHMRTRGEYGDFLNSRGDGCFTTEEIKVIAQNLEHIPGPIPTVKGWFQDRISLSSWIALVKEHWADIDGVSKEKRGFRTDFRTQMKARWRPAESEESDRSLDKAIDRVFFFIIRNLYDLNPDAINLERGKKGRRAADPQPATTELLRQCLTKEGFAIRGKVCAGFRDLQYVRPDRSQVKSSLVETMRLPQVQEVSRRTGKQYINDWNAMRACKTFEGVDLNNLRCGTFNVVSVQLFRYWLFFRAGGHSPVDNTSSQVRKPVITVTRPEAGGTTTMNDDDLDEVMNSPTSVYSIPSYYENSHLSPATRPPVTRPLGTTPSVTTPSVTTPSVTTPPVTTPQVMYSPVPYPYDLAATTSAPWSLGVEPEKSVQSPILRGQGPREHITFVEDGGMVHQCLVDLDQIRNVMHRLRELNLWVCDRTGRFLDPQYCLWSGEHRFKCRRKQERRRQHQHQSRFPTPYF